MDDTVSADDRCLAARLAEALELPPPESDDPEAVSRLIERTGELLRSERRTRQAAETLRVAFLELAKNLDPDRLFESLLDYLCWIVPYDRAAILHVNEHGHPLEHADRDFRENPRAEGLAEARRLETALSAEELAAVLRSESVVSRGGSRVVAPLVDGSTVLGAVVADSERGQYDERQLRLAESFASQATVAIRNARLFAERDDAVRALLDSYDATIEGWTWALELRDQGTEGHTRRVRDLTVLLARSMGVPEEDVIRMRRGATLHDIGKMAIPDGILLKPTGLNGHERELMKRHPDYARDLLEKIPFLVPSIDIPYCHHERWDGTGYPQGLRGEDIPLAARIFAVVDVCDALIYNRPYHDAWSLDDALEFIESQSGHHFDPAIVAAFLDLMKRQ